MYQRGRFNTFVMVPHRHTADYQQGGQFLGPDPLILVSDAALTEQSRFTIAAGSTTWQAASGSSLAIKAASNSTAVLGAGPNGEGYGYSANGVLLNVKHNGQFYIENASGTILLHLTASVASFRNATPVVFYTDNGVTEQSRFTIAAGSTTWQSAAAQNSNMLIIAGGTGGIVVGGATVAASQVNMGQNNNFKAVFGAAAISFEAAAAGTSVLNITATEFQWTDGATHPVAFYNAAGASERWRLVNVATIHRKVGDNATVDSHFECFDLPITSGQTLLPGDTAIWDTATPGRVIVSGANATGAVGIVLVGDTGDAGGTLKATIILEGYKAILTSDGVIVQMHRIKPGATVGRWADAGAGIIAQTIGFCLDAVGGSNLPFKAWITGPLLYT